MIRGGVVNLPAKAGPNGLRRSFKVMAGRCGFFGVNESLYPWQRAVYAAVRVPLGYGQAGLWRSANPIFFDKNRFRYISGKTVELHPAAPRTPQSKKFPGYNSKRDMNIVRLTRPGNTGQLTHTIINVHLASQFNVNRAWYDEVKKASLAKIRAEVKAAHARGDVVHLMGDFNISDLLFIVKGLVWLKPAGVDKYGVLVPAGKRLVVEPYDKWTEIKGTATDHNGGVACNYEILDGVV